MEQFLVYRWVSELLNFKWCCKLLLGFLEQQNNFSTQHNMSPQNRQIIHAVKLDIINFQKQNCVPNRHH